MIPLHCEESYFPDAPRHIWFFCETEPENQGQTPLGDMALLLDRLDSSLVQKFDELGVRYIYNLHGGNGFGGGWKEAFLTEDKDEVTEWLDAHEADYQWQVGDNLHMDLQGPGLRFHEPTQNRVWGNQAVNWHVDALSENMAAMMRKLYPSESDYPKHATFGDGSPISKQELDQILRAQESIEVAFDWEQGDLLWCDNQRIAHGRRTFTGQRKILVALA